VVSDSPSFIIKDCVLAAIATGQKAGSLSEFRDKLAAIDLECVYYHFWGSRLRPQFIHPDYQNDFASWAFHGLHDQCLAEKLGILDPIEYPNLEDLRKEVLNVVDDHLETMQMIVWSQNRQFYFLTSKIIIFDTNQKFERPSDFKAHISLISNNSIFYHFIDAKRRVPEGKDDFSQWLGMFGDEYSQLIQEIQLIDFYFLSLPQIKEKLIELINTYIK